VWFLPHQLRQTLGHFSPRSLHMPRCRDPKFLVSAGERSRHSSLSPETPSTAILCVLLPPKTLHRDFVCTPPKTPSTAIFVCTPPPKTACSSARHYAETPSSRSRQCRERCLPMTSLTHSLTRNLPTHSSLRQRVGVEE